MIRGVDRRYKKDQKGFSSISIKRPLLYCLLFTLCHLFLVPLLHASASIDISADLLEYDAKTNTYTARGSARVVTEDAILRADEIVLNRNTSDAVATGDVYYEDSETVIRAERIELNLRTRLGTIYKSDIFYKKNNYHIRGGDLKRLDKKSYYLDTATVTTCDAIPPPWHISGRDIKAVRHKHLIARDVTFYIKDFPFFYTPYFWMPLTKRRQTGFLVPSIGSSTTKGLFYKQGFFWAMRDDMDTTIYIDYFSKKGIGKGLEYRYIITPEIKGNLWIYHLRDNELNRDFVEFKTNHSLRLPSDISGYLKVEATNTSDYYRILGSTSLRGSGPSSLNIINLSGIESLVFDIDRAERLRKYLESNLYLSRPFRRGRAYLLGQFRQSLEGSSREIPQPLPEVGIVIYNLSRGRASLNITMKSDNFLRDEGREAQRIDINPNLYLSYGRMINITQRVGIRETAYLLDDPSEDEAVTLIDTSSTISTRLLKHYASFLHTIEPSIEYRYTMILNNGNIPVYDFIEAIKETNTIIYSITNRFEGIGHRDLSSRLRLSQRYDLLEDDRPFTSLLLEGGLSSKRVDFNINAAYDLYDERSDELFTSIRIKGNIGYIGIGKDFRRETDVDQYTLEGRFNGPVPFYNNPLPLTVSGKIWYDMKDRVVQESVISAIYKRQCWALTASLIKKPEEYQVSFGIEFIGLGGIRW